MKSSIIDKYQNYWTKRKFVSRALLTILAILICLMAVTYYGINVGTFVISIDDSKHASLALTEDINNPDYTARLNCKSLGDSLDADFGYIPENIDKGVGSKNDKNKRYFAYSFYLVNVGNYTTNYSMNFNIITDTRDLVKILRVLIIKDSWNSYSNVFALEKDLATPEPIIVESADNIIGYTVPFISDEGTIIQDICYDFQEGDYAKYTIVMWLDGWDSDQGQYMMGGKLKTEIVFSLLR